MTAAPMVGKPRNGGNQEKAGRKAGQGRGHSRRKPRLQSTVAIIDRLLLTPVHPVFNGQKITMTALEAIMYQLLQKDMAGDRRASRVLLRYEALERKAAGKGLQIKFPESDYTRALAKLIGRKAMADYEIGYGKPPEAGRFKAGRSGNPRGRPKPKPDPVGDIVGGVMGTLVRYRENGLTKKATRREVRLKALLERAVKGDVDAIELLLKIRAHAVKHRQGDEEIRIDGWLPDHPGQTGEQKEKELAAGHLPDPVSEG